VYSLRDLYGLGECQADPTATSSMSNSSDSDADATGDVGTSPYAIRVVSENGTHAGRSIDPIACLPQWPDRATWASAIATGAPGEQLLASAVADQLIGSIPGARLEGPMEGPIQLRHGPICSFAVLPCSLEPGDSTPIGCDTVSRE